MATVTALPEVLTSFTTAVESATQGLPTSASLHPPENGITLFDTKNEIFLSYLQALALRNLNVIRSIKDGSDAEAANKFSNEITKKLIEHRVYLEKGVRPLAQKIKYQVDRVVKMADDEERKSAQQAARATTTARAKQNGIADADKDDSDYSNDDSDSDGELGAGMTSFAPRVATMGADKKPIDEDEARAKSKSDGVYRPPRISATAMPTTERREKKERGPGRSATLDEYVSNELSTAPLAQPSIGSNLAAGGRQTKNARQLKEDAERRDYEETHLTRLPAMSKKDLARRGLGSARDGGFGGEEWRGMGESLDRIGDLTKRKVKDSSLDKSRKRRAVEDGPRSSGVRDLVDVKRRRMQRKGQI
ncbi:hypothetical protein DOTSEDRAFT_78877 [Dothistroma septosporum NZE10]|uniref:Uncharacterized protein n=1 Tax=Dothistroma septosporum (strain NZE10 / CBS 128990) TaxID=675120 RepID=N1PTG9_DOTSN|nr:hypothetical protein DOTSEDRAFT_78877 [Dothistroma septosporum NZE10]